MTDILKTLTALYGPSGNEGEVQAWILAYLREKQIDAHTDALGNIIAKVGGSGKKLVFSAHMDTVGVMLTDRQGRLRQVHSHRLAGSCFHRPYAGAL